MALNLNKSTAAKAVAPLNLTKSAKHLLTGMKLGLKWDGDTDLDAAALVLKGGKLLGGSLQTALVGYPMHETDGNGKFVRELWSIKGCTYSGDATDGQAEGFDEEIGFNLSEIEGDEIVLFLTSYVDAGKDPVTFGAALNPKASLCSSDGKELADVSLDEDAAFGTAFKLVRVFLDGGDWKVENVNEHVGDSANGLQDVINLYT